MSPEVRQSASEKNKSAYKETQFDRSGFELNKDYFQDKEELLLFFFCDCCGRSSDGRKKREPLMTFICRSLATVPIAVASNARSVVKSPPAAAADNKMRKSKSGVSFSSSSSASSSSGTLLRHEVPSEHSIKSPKDLLHGNKIQFSQLFVFASCLYFIHQR
jgi:hypothetical protein